MQTASSWIWTRVAVSISYDGNHYTINDSNVVLNECRWCSATETLLYNIQDEPSSPNPVTNVDNIDSSSSKNKYYHHFIIWVAQLWSDSVSILFYYTSKIDR